MLQEMWISYRMEISNQTWSKILTDFASPTYGTCFESRCWIVIGITGKPVRQYLQRSSFNVIGGIQTSIIANDKLLPRVGVLPAEYIEDDNANNFSRK